MCVGDDLVGDDPCEPSWTEHQSSNVLNGVENNTASTIVACQSVCVNNRSCNGIDWNIAGRRCYLHGSWSGRRNIGTSPGVTHYDLTRCGQSTEAEIKS